MFEQVDYDQARRVLGLGPGDCRVVIIGGSSGARQINLAAAKISQQLVQFASVLHVTGRGEQHELTKAACTPSDDYELREFVYEELALELAAADVVVTRAGATALAELAAISATAVVIPHPLLTDAHQLKNAQAVSSYDAGIIINQELLDSDPTLLLATVDELLRDQQRRKWLAGNLHRMFKPDAARVTAQEIRNVIEN
jgi:UDP-N-acetylglucosamine--N-acetylmuramyl-(pentapeptide) pyrophosphoryl-undecaprenol N-acetylglucosamine transferase